jgi:hypothetical protein|tara:strand:+ start:276 stop:446 length:171 start_codon:yes stop_codon:yes gene_type:complete
MALLVAPAAAVLMEVLEVQELQTKVTLVLLHQEAMVMVVVEQVQLGQHQVVLVAQE